MANQQGNIAVDKSATILSFHSLYTFDIGSKIFVAVYAKSVVAEPICTAHARDLSVHIAWVYSVQM